MSARDAGKLALDGQSAVVTGAGSGIGRAIALRLAAAGAAVCLVGRTAATLEAVAEVVRAGRADVAVCAADLSRAEVVEELAQGVLRLMGAVDVLIHAAGVHGVGTVHATPSAELDRHYHINLRAPYLLTRGLLGSLRSRRGQVVFVNSSAGVVARAGVGPYSASKHALRAIADSLREEVNPDGVRVLSVFLGRTATPMQEALHRAEGRAYRPERLLQPEDVAEVVEHLLALPRTAEVTDLHMRPLARWDVS